MDLEAVAEEGAVDRSAIAGSSTASTGGGTSTSSSPRERHTDFGPGGQMRVKPRGQGASERLP